MRGALPRPRVVVLDHVHRCAAIVREPLQVELTATVMNVRGVPEERRYAPVRAACDAGDVVMREVIRRLCDVEGPLPEQATILSPMTAYPDLPDAEPPVGIR